MNIPQFTITEELFAGADTALYRGYRNVDGTTVLLKALKNGHPTSRQLARIRHDHAMTKDLSLPGVLRSLGLVTLGSGLVLVLEHFGGQVLRERIRAKTVDLRTALRIAIPLSDALEEIHQHHTIHRDIKPDHVIVEPDTCRVKLIGFDIATRILHESQRVVSPDVLEGTLAYMSPEQTGRMNRTIDTRSDLYSAGVTLYEMLTGMPPFRSADPMELVHSQIARVPTAPHEVRREVPEPISAIVMKLVSKAAEDRYQRASGLKVDLERCLAQWESSGQILPFRLGGSDGAAGLHIPQKLYGRDQELSVLQRVWDRIRSGGVELALVSGHAGVGKSALVNEIQRSTVQHRGHFITGKFEELTRNAPYGAVARAFRELFRNILTEPEDRLAQWRRELAAALGPSGQVIVDVIPELGLVIGPQPAVPELGPTESQNRFSRVFQNFLRVFATANHPLVLFLDDLQWADPASLKLLQVLLADPENAHLLVIGAYRENEVGPVHPLSLARSEIQKSGTIIHDMTLKPLELQHVQDLVTETLSCDRKRSEPLAAVLFDKTHGNPFFLSQLLGTLYKDRSLSLDTRLQWSWDLERIRAMTITENVVSFMAAKLRNLPPSTQHILKLASCIGHRFDLRTLLIIGEMPPSQIAAHLWEALEEGLVLPLDAEYRFPHLPGPPDTAGGPPSDELEISYEFLHDRVQQAAYSLIDDEHKQEAHLRIGRLLWAKYGDVPGEELFDVVHHMNLGSLSVANPEERVRLAQLNLIASRRAKAATAYHSAAGFAGAGMRLLGEEGWEKENDLSFALCMIEAEGKHLSGCFEEADALFDVLLARAKSDLARAEVHNLRLVLCMTLGKFADAFRSGGAGLALLGIHLPEAEEERTAMLGAELAQVQVSLAGRRIQDLIDAPLLSDPHKRVALRLLLNLVAAAFYTGSSLFPILIVKQVNVSLEHGHSEVSAYGYMAYGLILANFMAQYRIAYDFGRLALELNEKLHNVDLTCQLNFLFGMYLHFYKSLRLSLAHFAQGYQAGLEVGDFAYVAYSYYNIAMTRILLGDELGLVKEELEKFLSRMRRTPDPMSVPLVTLTRQMALNLQGRTLGAHTLSDDQFDEVAFVEQQVLAGSDFVACWYYMIKLMLAVLYEDDSSARAMAIEAQKKQGQGVYFTPEMVFFTCVALLSHCPTAYPDEQQEILETVSRCHDQMATWAASCPENYQHKYALVAAELARVEGKGWHAMDLYDEAVRGAAENGFVHHQALANELAAKFYRGLGRKKVAAAYVQESIACYRAWGATTKVARLERKYADVIASHATQSDAVVSGSGIDVLTVIKASQALSGEVDLGRLLQQLMTIAIENAGAEKGYLIRDRDDHLLLEAVARVERGSVSVDRRGTPVESCSLPSSILHYVRRTREAVILDHAFGEERFSGDEYMARERPKSVLCLPLLRQSKLVAVLYLENNLTTGAFTRERLSMLEILASQAAISLENASLYADLEQENAERRRAEEEVRKLNSELELRVLERTAQLRVANQELEAFSYSVSHDLRAPLRTINGFNTALLEEYGDKLDARGQDYMARVHKASQRMAELIEDLLSLSRVTRTQMRRERVDLSAIAHATAIDLQKTAPERNVEWVIARGVTADCDERLLKVVLENLLGNSWKFTGKRPTARIEFGTRMRPDGAREIVVRDDGAGFDMQYADKLFSPFQRMHRADEFPGTGIGLATVQRIVERHGGTIRAESVVGQGTTFHFTV